MNETEIKKIVNTQRTYFYTHATIPVEHRLKALKRLRLSIQRHQEEIDEAKRRMREWMDDQLIANPTAGAVDSRGREEGPLTLKKPRANVWAFISWDKR